MKREHLFWLLTTTTGAAPLLQWGQGSVFDYNGLRFAQDGTFKISVFEDLHFGEPDSWQGRQRDAKTITVMNSVLDAEKPNLAVLNGDLFTADAGEVVKDNISKYINQLVAPLQTHNVPWASTYGNHDQSKTCSTRDMLVAEQAAGGLTKNMLLNEEYNTVGTSNYYIPIYESGNGGNPNLAMLLWFFDSKGGKAFTDDTPLANYVDDKVVQWFTATRNAIVAQHPNQKIPSLAFVHIPVHAMQTYRKNPGVKPDKQPGINANAIGHQGMSCANGGTDPNSDTGCHWNQKDMPFMQALCDTEGLMAAFSGHDHGDDWCMRWTDNPASNSKDPWPYKEHMMHLCFGRHTGYAGVGQWTRGARIIHLNEADLKKGIWEPETWIRLEDPTGGSNGKITGHVTLNSSYGTDTYPVVDVTYTGL